MPDRRLEALLATAAAIVVGIIAAVVVTLGGTVPPASGAARLVPADALVYLHLSTDEGRASVQEAVRVAKRFPDYPLLSDLLDTRLEGILTGSTAAGLTVNFSSQIRPWLGKEAAFALLYTPTSTAGSLIVLDVRDRRRASAFLRTEEVASAGTYRGTQLLASRSGTALAFVRHYLVIGQLASVKAALDVAGGYVPSLASSSSYRAAAAGEPPGRFVDAYASAEGVRRVLAAQGGLLGALGVLLYQPALTASTISISAQSSGLRVRVHGALNAALARLDGPAPRQFAPTLAAELPSGTTLLLDTSDLEQSAPQLFRAGSAGGVGGRVGPLLTRLGDALRAEGVDVARLEALFSGESAIAVSPGGVKTSSHTPALVIVTRTRHQVQTRQLLAQVEAPLAALFPAPGSGPGAVPEFDTVQVGGVTARQMALEPGLRLDYAVFRGLVVISTSLAALGGVVQDAATLADEPAYKAVLSDQPGRVTSLVFLDFSQLLGLVEQAGLTRSARLATLRPDLEKIRAIGLESTRGEADTTSELTLQIP